jgi:hypothetical protein
MAVPFILPKEYENHTRKFDEPMVWPQLVKDEVLLTVGCPIFPPILIAKYLFVTDLLWLFRSFYLRRSSIERFVERYFFIKILFQVYFDFA